ncbi:MAG TPA: hypothetical protein VIG99_02640 [Myxococcaceae bacterium]|jgi:hypothetical protein
MKPLRLMVYDRTCGALTTSWWLGGHLSRALGRLDDRAGFDRWPDALRWLRDRSCAEGRPIGEIQYWGHGHPGLVRMAGERLDRSALSPGHPLFQDLEALRDHLAPGGQALFWFRTCETFAGPEGHAFARAWTRFFSARAAGHTFIIGPLQSGLHVLDPSGEPDWPLDEGGHVWSSLRAPATISFLHGTVTPGPWAGSGAGPERPRRRRP